MAEPTKIILDTDPGGDDIFAFLWLLSLVAQGKADLVAITAAAGNVAARQTFTNSAKILELAGFDVPVGRAVRPTAQPGADAGHIHGADGMGNLSQTLPPPAQDFDTAQSADDLLIEQLSANPGAITLVAIGPLTNLAAAEAKQPGILKQAKAIVVMGGAFGCPGNVTAQAEFNIWFDPDAAQTVLGSRDDVVILPLDVTRQLVFTPEMAATVVGHNPDGALASFVGKLYEFMVGTALQHRETGGQRGFLVHDAATIGYLFYPQTLMLQRSRVQVETQGELTLGQTVVDRRSGVAVNANAWVALQVDHSRFFTEFIADLKGII